MLARRHAPHDGILSFGLAALTGHSRRSTAAEELALSALPRVVTFQLRTGGPNRTQPTAHRQRVGPLGLPAGRDLSASQLRTGGPNRTQPTALRQRVGPPGPPAGRDSSIFGLAALTGHSRRPTEAEELALSALPRVVISFGLAALTGHSRRPTDSELALSALPRVVTFQLFSFGLAALTGHSRRPTDNGLALPAFSRAVIRNKFSRRLTQPCMSTRALANYPGGGASS